MNKHFTLNGWKMLGCLLMSILFYSASLSAQTVLQTRNVSNTTQCNNGTQYGFYILAEGEDPYYTLNWATFTEYSDGTAQLTGAIVNNENPDLTFNVHVEFSGRTFNPPAGSPRDHVCHPGSTDGWYYYPYLEGTLTGVGQCWGTMLEITSVGPSFQVGNGANITSSNATAFGGSGWLNITVTSQNAWGPEIHILEGNNGQNGDINIILSGQPLSGGGGGGGGSCNNVTNGGTIGGNQTVCAGDAANTLTNIASPSGGSGALEYLWLSSTTECPTNINQAVPGANNATYNPGVLTQTTKFVRCSRRAGCTDWTVGESNCVIVTVDNSPDCGSGGCTDNDGDGVCANEDCNDSDASIPAAPGTSCNDGNQNTTNDVIQSDGCTCAGTNGGGGGGGDPDCANIDITTGDGTIIINGTDGAPVVSVQVFTSTWAGIFNCFADCDTPTQIVNVPNAGDYLVYVKYYNGSYGLVCEINETVTVGGGGGGGCTDNDNDGVCADEDCNDNNASLPANPGTPCNDGDSNTTGDVIQSDGCTCAGTGGGGGGNPDCADITLSTGNGTIIVGGTDGAPVVSVQVFTATWSPVFNCFNNCDTPSQTVDVPSAGNYLVYVKYYDAGYNLICEINETVTVGGGGGGGCTDNDDDGVCADADCNDNDASVPADPGTPCNDGNPNTTGDVIQADGCTCAGTGGNLCTLNLVATVSNIQCDNNGTPDNPNDDLFTFQVTVTGGNPWGWTGGGRSGDMGVPVTFGPYAIAAGNVSFTIVDNDNPNCTTGVDVDPPAPCSNGGGGGGGDDVDLKITVSGDGATVNPYTSYSVTVTIMNEGDATSNNVVVNVPQPDGVVFQGGNPSDASQGSYDPFGTFNWTVGTLTPGQTETLVLNYFALNGAPYTTYAQIQSASGNDVDSTPGNGTPPTPNEDDEGVYTTGQGGGGGGSGVLTLDGPNDITVAAAPGAAGANVNYPEPTASTTCPQGGLSLQRTAGPASGAFFPIGTTTVTYQATDACGNSETVSFTVTVIPTNTNLNINCPNNITVNAAPGANSATVTYSNPTANTTCAGGADVQRTAGLASGANFPVGTTTVTFQATDDCGNTETCSFTVTVVGQNSNITISCPSNISVDTAPGANSANVTYGNASANTNCAQGGLNVQVTQGPASGAAFPVGTTTVKYTATDNCGGMAMCTFTVTVTGVPAPDEPCEIRNITGAARNCTATNTRAFYAAGLISGISGDGAIYSVSNGQLREFEDGTAELTADFINIGNSGVRWHATVHLSGRTFNTPANSPKHSDCYAINDHDWYYYTSLSGMLTGSDHIAGAKINITLLGGQAIQFGTGANLFDQHLFGASSWLDYSIASQPNNSNVHLNNGAQVDFNFRLSGGDLDCPDAPQGNSCDLDVLFVVGSTTLSAGDNWVKNRLTSQGYNVMVKSATAAQTSDANGKDLVLISSTVLSTDVGTKYKHVTVPVMTWESYLYDDLRMTNSTSGSGYGTLWGVRQYQVANNHPINSGLSGTFNVFTEETDISWGYPWAASNDIGFVPNQPTKCMILAYEEGQEMFGGFHAPARRIGFFLRDNNATKLNAKGKQLFDQAIQYATNCYPSDFTDNDAEAFVIGDESAEIEAEERTDNATATPLAFGIYPNPATTAVNVSLQDLNGENVVIRVYDQLGRLIERAEADAVYNTVYRINTEDYTEGMYMISVQAGDAALLTKQVVILRQ